MKRKIHFIILPFLLLFSTSIVFYFFSTILGKYQGYLIGFLFYWCFWCIIVPIIVSKKNILSFFKNEKPLFVKNNWWIILLLLSTIVAPVFMFFLPELTKTPIIIILISIPLAIIHGFFEELFWRGLYIKEFPNSLTWGVIIPTIFFAFWHIAPQLSIKADNGVVFIISTLPLGLIYGVVAYVTKSAKWSAIAHSASGIFAYSGFLSISLYNIIQ